MEQQDLEVKRGFFGAPYSGVGLTLVLFGFLFAEGNFARDFAFMRAHHLPMERAWAFQLMILVALSSMFFAFWNGGWRKFGGTWKNYSVFYFSNAVFWLLLGMQFQHDLAEIVGRAKATLGP